MTIDEYLEWEGVLKKLEKQVGVYPSKQKKKKAKKVAKSKKSIKKTQKTKSKPKKSKKETSVKEIIKDEVKHEKIEKLKLKPISKQMKKTKAEEPIKKIPKVIVKKESDYSRRKREEKDWLSLKQRISKNTDVPERFYKDIKSDVFFVSWDDWNTDFAAYVPKESITKGQRENFIRWIYKNTPSSEWGKLYNISIDYMPIDEAFMKRRHEALMKAKTKEEQVEILKRSSKKRTGQRKAETDFVDLMKKNIGTQHFYKEGKKKDLIIDAGYYEYNPYQTILDRTRYRLERRKKTTKELDW